MRRARLGCLFAVLVGFAACGSDGAKSPSPAAGDRAQAGALEPAQGARPGGTIEVLSFLYPDTLDPGQAYSSSAYPLVMLVHRPLYAYIGDARRPKPDLAAGPPDIAADGRTVTVRLRSGVRFGAPVNREVVAADVRTAIERAFLPSVANPYARDYLGALRGVEDFVAGKAEHITGIEVPDPGTIRFRLSRPEGRLFSEALALPVSAPVPAEVSRKADAARRSTYDRAMVATGPYRVAEQSTTRVVLERNPDWVKKTDIRPALPDRFVWRRITDISIASLQVIRGSGLLFGPGPPPSARVIRDIAAGRYAGQTETAQMPGFVGFALNTQRAPFDDLDVRRSVFSAIDRDAVLQSVGGPAAGKPATHLIPPGVPGHEEAGGAAGPRIAAGSRAPTTDAIDIVSPDSFPFGQLVQHDLERAGFRTRLRSVPFPQIPKLCTGTRAGAHICFQTWAIDFFDAQTLLEPTFSGRSAGRPGSPNVAGLDDPELNEQMERARTINDPQERARAWGAIDRRIMELAAFVPVAWEGAPAIHSKDVASVHNPWMGAWDLNLTGRR